MSSIHPSAVIDQDTVIGKGTVVGPFVTIASGVVLGEHNIISKGVSIHKNVRIGNHNTIGENAVIGYDPASVAFDPSQESGVVMGNHNQIKPYVTIERSATKGGLTKIGNKNMFMVHVHIAHDCVIGDEVAIANFTALAGHVSVDHKTFISASCLFHQYLRVGKGVMVGAFSKVNGDVPPYIMIEGYMARYRGLNVVGLRRSGFTLEQRNLIKSIYHFLYQGNFSEGIKKISELPTNPIRDEILDFLRGETKRSIVRRER